MLKKIVEFSAKLLRKVKKLTTTPHFSEVVSGFKKFNDFLKKHDLEAYDIVSLITSLFLLLSTIGIVVIVLVIFFMLGG